VIGLRFGTAADADAVFRISEASLGNPWSRESLRSEFDRPDTVRFLVAENGGGIVGFIHWWRILDEAQVMNLAVLPDHRRRGIGAALLREAIRLARNEGASSMVLEVREGNTAARGLYGSAGFAALATRTGYYPDNGENAVFMRLSFVQV